MNTATTPPKPANTNRAIFRVSPGQMKRLLSTYATNQTRSAKSHMGDRKGSASGACILTVGIIVGHTPAAYRKRGESILHRWCDSRALEATVENEIARVRARDRYSDKIADLDHQRRIVVEHTYGIEGDPVFKAALSWAAADLERRLARVPDREIIVWIELMGG